MAEGIRYVDPSKDSTPPTPQAVDIIVLQNGKREEVDGQLAAALYTLGSNGPKVGFTDALGGQRRLAFEPPLDSKTTERVLDAQRRSILRGLGVSTLNSLIDGKPDKDLSDGTAILNIPENTSRDEAIAELKKRGVSESLITEMGMAAIEPSKQEQIVRIMQTLGILKAQEEVGETELEAVHGISPNTETTTIQLALEVNSKIADLANKSGKTRTEILEMALERGITTLTSIDKRPTPSNIAQEDIGHKDIPEQIAA